MGKNPAVCMIRRIDAMEDEGMHADSRIRVLREQLYEELKERDG